MAFAAKSEEAGRPSAGDPILARQPEEPAIDLVHLARQTLGDAVLEREILALFSTQLRSVADGLGTAGGRDHGFLVHGLKGTARSVGAFAVARACSVLEERGDAASLAALMERIAEAKAFADRLLA